MFKDCKENRVRDYVRLEYPDAGAARAADWRVPRGDGTVGSHIRTIAYTQDTRSIVAILVDRQLNFGILLDRAQSDGFVCDNCQSHL